VQDLVISVEAGAPAPLEPVRGRVFLLSGSRIEFAEDGRLVTPLGEFTKSGPP
jgi:hypothetical protein